MDKNHASDRTSLLEALSEQVTGHVSGHIGSVLALTLVAAWIVFALAAPESLGFDLFEKALTMLSLVLLFLVQRSQTKDTLSLQLKLNELLKAVCPADANMMNVESRSEEELHEIHQRHMDESPNKSA